MRRHKRANGMTMLETLIVIGIVVCVGVMLFPAIQASREKARLAQCSNNMKRLGLAVHNYVHAFWVLPPSSTVTRNADGRITAVDGWSWLVLVLPYTGDGGEANKRLYGTLDILNGRPLVEPAGTKAAPHADALATSLPGLLCPSFGGSPYSTTGTGKAAITNYKGSGATHIESLSVASPNPLTPKYCPSRDGMHPDGVLFPGSRMTFAAFRRGLSNAISAVESVEPNFSRWTVGAEAAVVGLPRNVEFEKSGHEDFYGTIKGLAKLDYVYGEDGRSTSESTGEIDPIYWTYHTYLDWDYQKSPYDGSDGLHSGRFGPSSDHPIVVNHLFCDGACRELSRDIDVTLYMLLIKPH